MNKALQFVLGVVAWLYDHEPLRTGLAVQVAIGGITGWLMTQGERLHLPGEFVQIITGLVGAALIGKVEEWKRSRVASAATAAKLLAKDPPVSGKPPIPLAVEAHEAAVEKAK